VVEAGHAAVALGAVLGAQQRADLAELAVPLVHRRAGRSCRSFAFSRGGASHRRHLEDRGALSEPGLLGLAQRYLQIPSFFCGGGCLLLMQLHRLSEQFIRMAGYAGFRLPVLVLQGGRLAFVLVHVVLVDLDAV